MDDLAYLALYFLLDGSEELTMLLDPCKDYGIVWEEQELTALVAFIQSALREMERRGERMLPPDILPERVYITRELRIFIGQKELKMRPMAKTVLLLFLQHPEGIVLKDIADHQAELLSYYRRVMRSQDPEAAHERVRRIIDIFNNELNVNISRVNAAISRLVPAAQQAFYQIHGGAGHSKSILLDRTRVHWEA